MNTSKSKPKSKSQPPVAFAFWGHDTFPFLLGGEVERFNEDGSLRIPDFQFWNFPADRVHMLFLNVEAGRKFWYDLNALKRSYDFAKDEMFKKFVKQVEDLIATANAIKQKTG